MHRRKFLGSAVAIVAATAASPRIKAVLASTSTPVSHIVKFTDFAFSPATLSVRKGDRVTWINEDIVPHTATADDGSWDTGELGPHGRGEIVVTEELAESYFCQFHPSMTAKLDVA